MRDTRGLRRTKAGKVVIVEVVVEVVAVLVGVVAVVASVFLVVFVPTPVGRRHPDASHLVGRRTRGSTSWFHVSRRREMSTCVVKGNALLILESRKRTEILESNHGAPFLASRSDGTGFGEHVRWQKNATVFTAEEEENL